MKRYKFHRSAILAAAITLGSAGGAWAAASTLTITPPAGSSPSVARFYTAPTANVGEFPGRLVALSCDTNDSAGRAQPNGPPQLTYVLVIQGDDTLHPLAPGTDEVRRELSTIGLHGANVTVRGKYYPSTGLIFVSRITGREVGTSDDHSLARDRTEGRLIASASQWRCANN